MLYSLKSLKRAKNPSPSNPNSSDKEQWWEYEIECKISNENNLIGWREGAKEKVFEEVKNILALINSRVGGKISTASMSAHYYKKQVAT